MNYFNQQRNILIENITNKEKENLDDNLRFNFFGEERKWKPWNNKSIKKSTLIFDAQVEIKANEINEKNTFHKQKFFESFIKY